jgi:Tfp pilus assembly protein PilE
MTLVELLVTFIPLLIALAVAVLVIRKTGAFEQRAHRQRVEQLLERIAQAVEKKQ